MKKRFGAWVFLCATLLLVAACGGGNGHKKPSQIRLVNSTHAAALSLSATDTSSSSNTATTVNSGVAEGTAGSYGSLSAATYTINVSTADGSLTASTQTLTLAADKKYTLVAYQRGGVINTLLLTDSISTPSSGFTSFTVANSSPDAGAVDVFVTTPGADITNLSPTNTNISGSSSSVTQSLTAGTYDIVVTATNKPTDVRLTLRSVALTSTEILVLALIPTTGGALVDAVFVQQEGAVEVRRVDSARVRMVAAFPANGGTNSVITAAVGGTALPALISPSVGGYSLAPAGSTTYGISVDGVAITDLPAATFASGGDYTILAYDSVSAPKVVIFSDNNQLPSTGAKIRLVNASGPNISLTFIDNYVPLYTAAVQYGTASTYAGVSSGSSTLQITSPVNTFTAYSQSVSLVSGGVYSVFVLGTNSTNKDVYLNKDR